MIIDLIFAPFILIAKSILALLPGFNFETMLNGVEGIGSLFNAIGAVSCFMPVDTFLQILALVAGIYTISVGWAFVNWLIAKIPTIN